MDTGELDMIMEIADSISIYADMEHHSQAVQRAAGEAIESSLKLVRFFRNQGIRSDLAHPCGKERSPQLYLRPFDAHRDYDEDGGFSG